MQDKLFIIDGHALVFKMYYALAGRPVFSSKGENTAILYGFTKYILENIIERQHPSHLAVAFDPPCKTFRHEMYPEYKATRRETPQEVRDALEPLCAICASLGIPVYMVPGYEADDTICTIAHSVPSDIDVYMVTPDKDYAQAVTDNVHIYRPGKGGSDDEILNKADVCEKYGVSDPLGVIDYLTIVGDTADNVKGVNGVGEKTAKDLLSKYGSLDGIYASLDKLTPSQRAKFEAAREYIGLSKDLITIKLDVPVEFTLDELRYSGEHSPSAAELFSRYEFNSLKKYLNIVGETAPEEAEPSLTMQAVPFAEFAPNVSGHLAVAYADGCFHLALQDAGTIYSTFASDAEALPLLASAATVKIGAALKELLHSFALGGHLEDVEVIHYLLYSDIPHDFEYLRSNYLSHVATDSAAEEEPAKELSLFDLDEPEAVVEEAEKHNLAADALMIRGYLHMDAASEKLYRDIEEPLIRVLAAMEADGVAINLSSLESYIQDLRQKLEYHENNVRIMAGDPSLNVSSPKQIGTLIFEKMQLDPSVKPSKNRKYAYSTDEETLSALREAHPIIDEILDYRAVRKLLSTYIEPLPKYIQDGKIHTSFNQTAAATGRLSSSNPNLQNIPIRTALGSQIRSAFVPSTPGGFILSADYSQIELRILAHLCGDEHLCKAFNEGVDVHSATAAKIFGVDLDEITPEQRRIAKTANFGILYGISAFGLAARLKISRKKAAGIIEDYFASFPAIENYIQDSVQLARRQGSVETMFGRKRVIPGINATNGNTRAFAERVAVNSPIQGASADIIKIAMINIARALESGGFASRMVLQIHDELLFDVVAGEEEALKAVVISQMENVVKLSVPLKVECNYGKNWLEVH